MIAALVKQTRRFAACTPIELPTTTGGGCMIRAAIWASIGLLLGACAGVMIGIWVDHIVGNPGFTHYERATFVYIASPITSYVVICGFFGAGIGATIGAVLGATKSILKSLRNELDRPATHLP
jgi:hypothetical protein